MDEDDDNVLRIDYDDDVLTIMDMVNAMLVPYGLVFVDDEQEHDGFEIYELRYLGVKT